MIFSALEAQYREYSVLTISEYAFILGLSNLLPKANEHSKIVTIHNEFDKSVTEIQKGSI